MESSTVQHTISINQGFKTVTVRHGAALLAGLARGGVLIPSACGGNAQCGACKVKLLSGASTSIGPQEDKLLSAQEKASAMRLSCQVLVENDLSIEIPAGVFAIKQFSGTLIEKQPLTYDIVRLRIALIKPDTIEYSAGQYVQIRSQPFLGKQAVVRAFSIASAPSDGGHIELMTRRVPSGICTAWIFDGLKPGDKVYFTAPYGDFKLKATDAPALFIAGGSGMAPMWSILKDMKETGVRKQVTFFFGAVTQRDVFLTKELFDMQRELPGFTFIPALSNEPADSSWAGERGLITEVVARHCADCSTHEAYLCGSPGMIEACKKTLIGRGMRDDKIYYDKFV